MSDSTESLKRAGGAVEAIDAKKQMVEAPAVVEAPVVDHFAKGIAPIKPEFIIPQRQAVTFDDEEGLGDRENEDKSRGGKRARGQNKKRDLAQVHEVVRLCSTVLDPDNVTECRFGPSRCKNTHNVEEYLLSKPVDLPGVCPVFRAIGYCPAGLKCRWLGSHYHEGRLVRDEAVAEAARGNNYEVNKADGALKAMLQRKKFDFSVSETVVAWLDGKVSKDLPKTVKDVPSPMEGSSEVSVPAPAEVSAPVPAEASASAEVSVEASVTAPAPVEASASVPAPASVEASASVPAPVEASASVPSSVSVHQFNHGMFVDVPFRACEKKRLNLHRAKIVSPLTTVGNLPYRRLMKTLGADVTYSEMALAFPLLNGANAEWALPKAHISEYPGFGVQIATAKHWQAVKATEALARLTTNVSEVNLNSGCPIDLLYKQGQGSALMELAARMTRILNGMSQVSGDIPVTLKIRTGTKDGHWNGTQIVRRMLHETDVAAITMHGRSRQQRYSKEADWDYIGQAGQIVEEYNNSQEDNKEASESRRVFFVGNGDCYNFEDWHRAVERKGVDSVMVARGALIKPWIFEEVEAGQYLDKSATERLAMLKTYADFAIEHWGSDEYGIKLARRFMCEFLSFFHRYIPVGIMERLPAKLNQRPPSWRGRDDLETLLGSNDYKDWIKITEMFFGPCGEDFAFVPKHKSSAH